MKTKVLAVLILTLFMGLSVCQAGLIPSAMVWKYDARCADTPDGTDIMAWEHPSLPQPSKAQVAIDVAEYEQYLIDEQAVKDALSNQIDSEKTALPTWAQVATAIDNAFPDAAQAGIIKKIARPVYTYLKNSVD